MRKSSSDWSIVAFLIGINIALLYFQRIYDLISPDVAFHISKIICASRGSPFLDPVLGVNSVYPAYFHIIYGVVYKLHPSIFTIKILWIAQYASFLIISALLFREVNKNIFPLLFFILPFLYYAPTGKYILLLNPFNFSLNFVLLALLMVVRGVKCRSQMKRRKYIYLSSIFSGVSSAIWWPNVLIWILVYYFLREEMRRLWLGGLLAFLAVFSSLFFVQMMLVRDMIHEYFHAPLARMGGEIRFNPRDAVVRWLTSVFLRGDVQFLSKLHLISTHQMIGVVLIFNSFLCSFIFSSLILLAFWSLMVKRNKIKQFKFAGRSGVALIFALLFLSPVIPSSYLRRLSFVAGLLLLPYLSQSLSKNRKRIYYVVLIAGFVEFLFVAVWDLPSLGLELNLGKNLYGLYDQALSSDTQTVAHLVAEIQKEYPHFRALSEPLDLRMLVIYDPVLGFSLLHQKSHVYYTSPPEMSEKMYKEMIMLSEKLQNETLVNLPDNIIVVLNKNTPKILLRNVNVDHLSKIGGSVCEIGNWAVVVPAGFAFECEHKNP